MKTLTEFDYKKATQAINFFACKSSAKQINEMKVIKLIWLADRYHLRKYGRPIVGDDYMAMPYGPVGSTIKDIAEKSDFLAKEEREYSDQFLQNVDQYTIKCIANPDTKVFSKTDIEALEFAYGNFGKLDQFKLAKLSHKYPEWSRFKQQLISGLSYREDMSYLDFFENPVKSSGDLFAENSDTLEENKKVFIEKSQTLSDWF